MIQRAPQGAVIAGGPQGRGWRCQGFEPRPLDICEPQPVRDRGGRRGIGGQQSPEPEERIARHRLVEAPPPPHPRPVGAPGGGPGPGSPPPPPPPPSAPPPPPLPTPPPPPRPLP